MKSILPFRSLSIALCVVALCAACEDKAQLEALKTKTGALETKATEQNDELTNLSKEIQDCKVELAEVSKSAAVIREEDVTIPLPTLDGDVNIATLTSHEVALTAVVDEQAKKLDELTADKDKCTEDLAKAKAKAKKRAERRAKPKAVKVQEAKGQPTTGAASRYKRR